MTIRLLKESLNKSFDKLRTNDKQLISFGESPSASLRGASAKHERNQLINPAPNFTTSVRVEPVETRPSTSSGRAVFKGRINNRSFLDSLGRWLILFLLATALNGTFVAEAIARMGGGHTYSGGQSEGGGSGSGGSGRAGGWSGGRGGGYFGGYSSPRQPGYETYLPTQGQHPENAASAGSLIEILFLVLLIWVLLRLLSQGSLAEKTQIIKSPSKGETQDFSGAFKPIPGMETEPAREDPWATNTRLDDNLRALQSRDPNFSRVLFLDFASLLFHKFYSYRGTDRLRLLSPFLAREIFANANGNVFYVSQRTFDIVIGQARVADVYSTEQSDHILVEFESNLTVRSQDDRQDARYATQERWLFGRNKGVLSPQPTGMRNLICPSCGAPADFTDAGECQYCRSFIQAGEIQWQIVDMDIVHSQPLVVEAPGAYQQETGTTLPTVRQAGLRSQLQDFAQAHGLADWESYFGDFCERVVKPYFLATYDAWSRGDFRRARHLVSDRLFESNEFWMKEYARAGWRNRLENIHIQDIEMARMDLDAFYESITVRIFASCLDYTVDPKGHLVGGSRSAPRAFSEYWTFIRVAGAEKIDQEYDPATCPACGAPADRIGQAGACGYCGSKLTDGDFSWILALIAQDEAFKG